MIRKILFCLCVLAGLVQAQGPSDKVPYKQIGDVELALHVFNPPGHQPSDQSPAIVFFFGGGWAVGQAPHFYPQSRHLASRGMVAICAEYRTKKKHSTPPSECLKDAKSAMRWVRAHAVELGIDPNRLAAGGGSAGGHLAAATAVCPGFNEENDDLSVSCRPDALVLFNPVFDNGPKGGYGYSRVKEYWEDFSPMNNLRGKVPPTLVMFGTIDQYVPVATVEAYKARMDEIGARCDLILYEGEKHSFFNKSKYTETVIAMDKFLTSLGYLQGAPTLQP